LSSIASKNAVNQLEIQLDAQLVLLFRHGCPLEVKEDHLHSAVHPTPEDRADNARADEVPVNVQAVECSH
jgi:hypothetical protein